MMTKIFLRIVLSCSLVLVGVLSGCSDGGGGGDGDGFKITNPEVVVPASYTGNTEQAVITADNAVAIVQHLDTYGFRTEPAEVAYDIMERNLIFYDPRDIPPVLRVDSDCGGYYGLELRLDETTGSFVGGIYFVDFCVDWWDSDLSITGAVGFKGSGLVTTDDFKVNLELNFVDVTAQTGDMSLTFTDGTEIYDYLETATELNENYKFNYVLRDNSNPNKNYWALDTVLIFNYVFYVGPDQSVSSGLFYDYDYGFVDINTDGVIALSPQGIKSGVIIIAGMGSKAKLTFNADGSNLLEVDADNDGAYDDASFVNVL